MPPESYLDAENPTYHNCVASVTGLSHDNQTAGYWPCLSPKIFNPVNLNPDQWMEASAALGMKEICITAKHQGGFTLWPSKFTPYGVQAATNFQGGKGDPLKQFVAAAKRWNIKVCYYFNPLDDGYLAQVANVTAETFMAKEKGMLTELLSDGSPYGPVHRLWFDGAGSQRPAGLLKNYSEYYDSCFQLIRTLSPQTLISPYRGDVCMSTGSLYTNSGPAPNSSDSSGCGAFSEEGKYFHPTEMHGITMQEGPDGNTDAQPTYWFWHPWACAKNITGCPWIGHANASRIFDSYIVTVGRGAVLNMNIPPERTGRMNVSVAGVMAEAGKAINDTFKQSVAAVGSASGQCTDGVAEITVPAGVQFDYIMTMEDLVHGQRFGNYSIDFQQVGSSTWETLVPPANVSVSGSKSKGLQDRPDGHDPRDSHIGHKRIDLPVVATSGPAAVAIAKVRLNCLRAIEEPVYVRSFSLHKKTVPWE
eukprot:m.426235 g.426235  ORF g.426235 m.426235 type:complete len:476 (-) comp16862_c0_seq31:140-1567(-)